MPTSAQTLVYSATAGEDGCPLVKRLKLRILLAQPRAADAWNKGRPTDVSQTRSFITKKKDIYDVGLVKVQPVELGPNW